MFPAAGGWDRTGMEDYRTVNRASWDEHVPAHAASPDYQLERYAADPGFLSQVVRFDLPQLGAISGLRGVHLQCHIGTDTVSLARLGASMTGLDFSAPAVELFNQFDTLRNAAKHATHQVLSAMLQSRKSAIRLRLSWIRTPPLQGPR